MSFVGYACILAIGDCLTALLPRDGVKPGGGERTALAFALGVGAVSLLLFWGSLIRPGGAGISWVLLPTVSLLALRWRPWRRHEWARALAASPVKWGLRPQRPDWGAVAAFLALGAAILPHLGASLARDLGGDGLAIYGIKARAAFVSGGMPTSYLVDASREFSHLNYPWLVPLAEMWLYLLAGEVQEGLVKPLFTGFFAGILLLLYSALRRYRSRPFSLSLTALAAVLPTLNQWSLTGSADTAVAFYWLGSVLYLHRWLLSGSQRDLVVATLLVALAAWTKREGLVYLAFQGGILLIAPLLGRRVRDSIRGLLLLAGMSAAIVGPWLLLQSRFQVADSVFVPVDVPNTLARLDRVPTILAMLVGELGLIWHWGLLWILFCCALPTLATGAERRARVYLAASVLVPLLALALGYAYTRWEPFTVHVGFSVDRLALQQAPLAALFVALQLGSRPDRVSDG